MLLFSFPAPLGLEVKLTHYTSTSRSSFRTKLQFSWSLSSLTFKLHCTLLRIKLYVTSRFFCFKCSLSLSRKPLRVQLLLTSSFISPRRSLDLTIISLHSSILVALHFALSTSLRFQFRLQYLFTLLWLTLHSCFGVLHALLRTWLRIYFHTTSTSSDI